MAPLALIAEQRYGRVRQPWCRSSITIGVRHYDEETGRITTVREAVRTPGRPPDVLENLRPPAPCECPRHRAPAGRQREAA